MFMSLILINILFLLLLKLYTKLTCGICTSSQHMVGKVVIVTGGNAGIGLETARSLAERGARVLLACRDPARGAAARDLLAAATGNQDVHYRPLDLASLASVRQFADNILKTEKRLDVLINNAGSTGFGFTKTEDGLVTGMQVNHFASVLLTSLLLPLLKASAPSRIINVSSLLHTQARLRVDNLNMEKETEDSFRDSDVYCNSKLCNILVAVELARQLEGTGVTVNALHPGYVKTDILKKSTKNPFLYALVWLSTMMTKDPWEGAQTSIFLAVSPEVEGVSGCYFSDCHIANASRKAQDRELAKKVWERSLELVNGVKLK
ncbi:retinol dehydrogenase 11 [Plutella xylostella]|uniref:retinol dehydrogenase 11 n=1 Tax=Plutella xylostella TaxID=51655 RepID=UPI002032242A|nr:retinol dehydrogenase 11 [Plutella xylostella]